MRSAASAYFFFLSNPSDWSKFVTSGFNVFAYHHALPDRKMCGIGFKAWVELGGVVF